MKDCENLRTLHCASCYIEELNLEGCANLETLNCSNNSLPKFDASALKNLRSLECKHQRIYNKPLAKLMNLLDFLLGRGMFGASAAEESDEKKVLSNVKNLTAYDAAGHELSVEFDSESGAVEFSSAPAKIGYDYSTGFNGVMMDVEVYPSEYSSENEGVDNTFDEIGSANGGCISGLGMGALGMILVLVLMLKLPRKKAE